MVKTWLRLRVLDILARSLVAFLTDFNFCLQYFKFNSNQSVQQTFKNCLLIGFKSKHVTIAFFIQLIHFEFIVKKDDIQFSKKCH